MSRVALVAGAGGIIGKALLEEIARAPDWRGFALSRQGGDVSVDLTDASLSESGDFVETNYLGGSGYKSRVQTLKDTSADLSGHFMQGDAPQAVLRSARDTVRQGHGPADEHGRRSGGVRDQGGP